MTTWQSVEIVFEVKDGMDLDAITDALFDCAADLFEDGEWTGHSAPSPDPDPECTCGPQPPNGQMIRSGCPRHATHYVVTSASSTIR